MTGRGPHRAPRLAFSVPLPVRPGHSHSICTDLLIIMWWTGCFVFRRVSLSHAFASEMFSETQKSAVLATIPGLNSPFSVPLQYAAPVPVLKPPPHLLTNQVPQSPGCSTRIHALTSDVHIAPPSPRLQEPLHQPGLGQTFHTAESLPGQMSAGWNQEFPIEMAWLKKGCWIWLQNGCGAKQQSMAKTLWRQGMPGRKSPQFVPQIWQNSRFTARNDHVPSELPGNHVPACPACHQNLCIRTRAVENFAHFRQVSVILDCDLAD